MNTRLQVEHPVTECITGLDLVELMIRVAAGEPLPFTQERGPARRLGDRMPDQRRRPVPQLPAVDRPAGAFQPPPQTHVSAADAPVRRGLVGVRVDTGVYEGGEISMYYDSMIAKLIVHGRDRAEAIAQMREALNALRHPRHREQHPVPGGAAGAPAVRRRRLQHRLHRRGVPEGLPRRGGAARRSRLPARAGRGRCNRAPARARGRHQRPAARPRDAQVGEDFVVVVTDARAGRAEQTPVTCARRTAPASTCTVARHDATRSRCDGPLRDTVVRGSCNGEPFCAQVERLGLGYRAVAQRRADRGARCCRRAPPSCTR